MGHHNSCVRSVGAASPIQSMKLLLDSGGSSCVHSVEASLAMLQLVHVS